MHADMRMHHTRTHAHTHAHTHIHTHTCIHTHARMHIHCYIYIRIQLILLLSHVHEYTENYITCDWICKNLNSLLAHEFWQELLNQMPSKPIFML